MRFWLLLNLLTLALVAMARGSPIDDRPKHGEAHVWYLGHAGWLVRTSEHFLIFDYTGPVVAGDPRQGTLSGDLFGAERVLLFVSHAHGDHFSRSVLDLRDSVENLNVIMGWDEPRAGPAVNPTPAEWTNVAGASVFTLHHAFDGIPEGFFLIRSGGVTLYHSGDHGTWSEPPNETFRANIDKMAGAVERIDIAFLSAFGRRGRSGALNPGDTYSIRTLGPKVTFPMHRGGTEHQYAAFAQEVSSLGLATTVGVAEKPGAFFHYRDGELLER